MSHLLLEAVAESAVDCGYHPTITINMDSAQPVFSAKDILQAHIPLVSVNSILKKLSAAREQYHGACPTTAAHDSISPDLAMASCASRHTDMGIRKEALWSAYRCTGSRVSALRS